MEHTFDMDAFIADELGAGWTRLPDSADGAVHAAFRADLGRHGFACNVAVHEIAPGEPRDLRSTIPTAPVLLAAAGLDERGPTAELLFVDTEPAITQWIGYRFATTPPLQIVVSASTAEWPDVAATVARLATAAARGTS